jgi:hypothetical protein
MNEANQVTAAVSAISRHSYHPASPAPAHASDLRIMELEHENSRLQKLVAELLLKNQQLRKGHEDI